MASPELIFVLFLFLLVSVPVFIGAVVLINRSTDSSTDEEIAELQRRVEELESDGES